MGKKRRTKMGRPAKPKNEKYVVAAISFPPDMAEYVLALGGDSMSRGVQIAIDDSRELRKRKSRKSDGK